MIIFKVFFKKLYKSFKTIVIIQKELFTRFTFFAKFKFFMFSFIYFFLFNINKNHVF